MRSVLSGRDGRDPKWIISSFWMTSNLLSISTIAK